MKKAFIYFSIFETEILFDAIDSMARFALTAK